MADKPPRMRLYVDDLALNKPTLHLTGDRAHYIGGVMRGKKGDGVLVFNQTEGEWLAVIEGVTRKTVDLTMRHQTRPPEPTIGPRLLLAPLKKARFDFAIEKAVELGVRSIHPVITAHTDVARVRTDRMVNIAIEAAEQCERLDLPTIDEPRPLFDVLADVGQTSHVFACFERSSSQPLADALQSVPTTNHAILIGPEGGFDQPELDRMQAMAFVSPVTLGARILRAETAAIAALAVWQSYNHIHT